MARSLADLTANVTNKARVMNPFTTPVTIHQDVVIGTAEKIGGQLALISERESKSECASNCNVKRIKMESETTVTEENRSKHSNQIPDKVPQHQTDIFEESSHHLSSRERQRRPKHLLTIRILFQRVNRIWV